MGTEFENTPVAQPSAIGVLEVSSIAKGYVVLDSLVKRALVTVRLAEPVTPGKFVILFHGQVADVEESMAAAQEAAGSTLIDELYLSHVHPQLLPALTGTASGAVGEAVAIIELSTIAATLHAADIALKATEVSVLKMHLAVGIGGKGFFTLGGEHADIESAMDAIRDGTAENLIVSMELIPRPHAEVRGFLS